MTGNSFKIVSSPQVPYAGLVAGDTGTLGTDYVCALSAALAAVRSLCPISGGVDPIQSLTRVEVQNGALLIA